MGSKSWKAGTGDGSVTKYKPAVKLGLVIGYGSGYVRGSGSQSCSGSCTDSGLPTFGRRIGTGSVTVHTLSMLHDHSRNEDLMSGNE